jgi:hypothetical protein
MTLDDMIERGRQKAGSDGLGTNGPATWRFNSTILRVEAAAAFIAGGIIWVANGGSLLWFIPLLFVADISMIGYLGGSRLGAVMYNLAHNWALAAVLLGMGWWVDGRALLFTGALLLAHVGMDRALGYGLKLPGAFQETHLGWIGPTHDAHG